MCLTIPGRVVSVEGGVAPSAVVEYEGVTRSVSLLYLPDLRPGEYILAQAGFAIQRVPESEALEALAMARRPVELPGSVPGSPRAPARPAASGGGP